MLFGAPEGLGGRAEGSWLGWESLPGIPAGWDGGSWLECDPSGALGCVFPAAGEASEVAGAALAPGCAGSGGWAGAFPSELENAGRAQGCAGARE